MSEAGFCIVQPSFSGDGGAAAAAAVARFSCELYATYANDDALVASMRQLCVRCLRVARCTSSTPPHI